METQLEDLQTNKNQIELSLSQHERELVELEEQLTRLTSRIVLTKAKIRDLRDMTLRLDGAISHVMFVRDTQK